MSVSLRWIAAALAVVVLSCSQPGRSARYVESGKKFLAQKDYARAILEFKNAIEIKNDDAEAYYQLGLAYLARGEWAAAAAALQRATELKPKHAEAQVRISELLASTSDAALLEEARKRLESVVKSAPGNVEALTGLAWTEWKLARPEEAQKHLVEALEKSRYLPGPAAALAQLEMSRKNYDAAERVLKASAEKSKTADACVVLGEFYLMRSRPADAEAQFRRALAMDANHPAALLHIGAIQARLKDTSGAEQTYKRISALPDKQYRSVYAMYLFESGRTDAAIAELERLVRQDPADRQTRSRWIGVLVAAGRRSEAESILNESLKKNPSDMESLLQRSALAVSFEKYTQAEEDLNRILRERRDAPEVHYLLSKVYGATGRVLMQRQALDEALRAHPEFLNARIELAMLMIRRNAAATALKVLEEAPPAQRKLAPVVLASGWAHLALGRTAEAERIVKLFEGANDAEAMTLEAALRLEQKRFQEAQKMARKILAVSPEDVRPLEILVNSHRAMGNLKEAGSEIAAHVARQPAGSPVLQQFLGDVLLASGNREEARKAYERARELKPSFLEPALALIRMDIEAKRWNEARAGLTALIATHGEDPTLRLWLGNIEQINGNHAEAIEHYRKVIGLDPNHVRALNNLAYLLCESGKDVDQALRYAEKAASLAGDNAAVVNTLGRVLLRKGLTGMAVRQLQRAAELENTGARQYDLALACLQNGDQKAARAALDQVVRLSPESQQAKEARRLMASIR